MRFEFKAECFVDDVARSHVTTCRYSTRVYVQVHLHTDRD